MKSLCLCLIVSLLVVGCSLGEHPTESLATETGGLSGDETGAEGATLAWTVDTAGIPPDAELKWIFGDGTIRMGGDHESHAYDDNGTHVLIVVALLGGQEIAQWTLDVVVTNAPPAIDLGIDRDWVPERPFRLSALVSDPGADQFTAHVDWGDGTAQDVELRGTALEADHVYPAAGTFQVTATVTDDDNDADTDTFLLTVYPHHMVFIDAQLPSWTSVGTQILGRVVATDVDGASLVVKLLQAPTGMMIARNGVITFTPAAGAVGDHTIVLSASDGVITTTKELTLTVSAYNVQASGLVTVASGGTITVTDPASPLYGARLEVPPHAVAADTKLAIAVVATPPDSDPTVGPIVELIPSGTVFAAPARLVLPYDPAALPPGVPPEQLSIETVTYERMHGGGTRWVAPAASTVNGALHTVSVQLEHFCTYRLTWGADTPMMETEHFFISWSKGAHAPVADLYYQAAKFKGVWIWWLGKYVGGEYNDDGVPFYIQDLADFFEHAYAAYWFQSYRVRDTSEGQYVVFVTNLGPGIEGLAYPGTGRIDIIPSEVDSRYLGFTAAHELFHQCQFDQWGETAQARIDGANRFATANGGSWIVESTANDMASSLYKYDYANPRYLLRTAVEGDASLGYDAFAAFKFARQHYADADLTHRFWSIGYRELAGIGSEKATAFFYRRLRELAQVPTARIWTDFAFAYQYSHSPNWLAGIGSEWSFNGIATSRAQVPDANLLTGKEREAPGPGELPAHPLVDLVVQTGMHGLARGSVVSYAVNALCDPDPARPCTSIEQNLETPAAWSIVFRPRPAVPNTMLRGAVYRMPLANTEPDLWYEFTGIDPEVEIPLWRLGDHRFDQLVVSFVNDPEAAPAPPQRIEVDVFFRRNNMIAFARQDDYTGVSQIWRVNESGGGATQLTNDPDAIHWCPAWSPDRRKIAFQAVLPPPDQNHTGIKIIDVDGGNPTWLSTDHAFSVGCPEWAPDGGSIAYVKGNTTLVQYDFITGLEEVLTPTACMNPDWSPDGTKIVCHITAFDPAVGHNSTEIYRLQNGVLTKLTSFHGISRSPHWSADGNTIVFDHNEVGVINVWVMDANGNNPLRVTNMASGDTAVEPAWNADGERIVFHRTHGVYGSPDYVTGLYLIRPDGTGLQPVTENFAGDHSTDYAPEGLQTRL